MARSEFGVFNLVLNMAVKRIRKVNADSAPRRERIIGLRLREHDRRRFEAMARAANVGVSTYARLVIERYIETHAPRRRS
jgi:hypothetical protein